MKRIKVGSAFICPPFYKPRTQPLHKDVSYLKLALIKLISSYQHQNASNKCLHKYPPSSQYTSHRLKTQKDHLQNLLYQSLNSFNNNIPPQTNRLNPHLIHRLQFPRFPDMGIRCAAGSELSRALGLETGFCVVSWAGVATCSCVEDCGFAGGEGGGGDKEDEFVFLRGGGHCRA